MTSKRLPWGTFSIVWLLVMLFLAQEHWFGSIATNQDQYNFLQQRLGGLDREKLLVGHQWWRIVTSFLIHHDASHLVNNLSLLIITAYFVEKRIGVVFLLSLFISSTIGASVYSIVVDDLGNNVYEVGSSGGVYGVLFALILIRGIELAKLKGEWIAKFAYSAISFCAFWFLFIKVDRTTNISHVFSNQNAHIGGAIAGAFFLLINSLTPSHFKNTLHKLYILEITIVVAVLIFRVPSTILEYESYKSYISIDSKAKDLFAKGDFQEAKKEWENLSQQFPEEWGPYGKVAVCCYNLKNYPCAKSNLDKAIELQPMDIESQRLKAEMAFHIDKDYPLAENLFANIVKSTSVTGEDYKLLATSILKQDVLMISKQENPKRQEELAKTISEGLNKFPNEINLLKLGFNFLGLNTDKESQKTFIEYGLALNKLKALPPNYLDHLVSALAEEKKCIEAIEALNSYQFKGLQNPLDEKISLLVASAKKQLKRTCP